MASQGPLYPGTRGTLANAGTSENANDWLTPANIGADDGSEAQITAATYDSPDISFILIGSNFGFTIPGAATIDGITVEIDRRSIIANSGKDFRVQLATGTTFADLVGTNKAVPATIWPTASTVATYGGAADTWSAGLTEAQVNAAGFAVFLSCQANIANADVGVDFIRVTVNYTAAAPTGTGAITVPSATVEGTGAEVFTATGTITVPPAEVAGSGAEVFTATGTITVEPPTVAGVGDHTAGGPPPVTGTGAISVPAAEVAGTGAEILTATGAITVPSATVVGSGALLLTGTGAIEVSAATVAGLGSEVFTGTGAIVGQAPTVAGTGVHAEAVTGTGAIAVPAPLVVGSGQHGAEVSGGPPPTIIPRFNLPKTKARHIQPEI